MFSFLRASLRALATVQDLLMELCCVVARHAPAYGIGVLLPDMLSVELSGWDALMISLRALLTLLIAAPLWSQNQKPQFEVCVGFAFLPHGCVSKLMAPAACHFVC